MVSGTEVAAIIVAATNAANSKLGIKIYDDLFSAPLKETSETVNAIISLVGLPLQFLADSLRHRLKERLEASIKKVPEENRVTPPLSILASVVNNLAYAENDLAELYQNLLARAIDKIRNSEAHPAFAIIISQLSPDEALLLYELKFNKFKFTRLLDLDNKLRKFYNVRMESNEFPVSKLIFTDNFDMYLEHLEKLDLVRVIERDSQPIWQDDTSRTNQIGVRDTFTMGFTKFGELFRSACLPDSHSA